MKSINIEEKILKRNEKNVNLIKNLLEKHNVYMVNILGSPGAGKTTILKKIINKLNLRFNIAVIEGDLYTTRDAERLESNQVEVVQINTGGTCHLEAAMIKEAINQIPLEQVDLLLIENVGNLVCTASYELGEDLKITVLSVPEGSDKLLKYPAIFQKAGAIVINKIDLIAYTDFSMTDVKSDLEQINRGVRIFKLSCTTEKGIDKLCTYLEERLNG